jgi:hypothetical protein
MMCDRIRYIPLRSRKSCVFVHKVIHIIMAVFSSYNEEVAVSFKVCVAELGVRCLR